MSERLPTRPNFTHLRRQGKKLLLEVRSGEPAALLRVEQHLPTPRKSKLNSRKAAFGLRDALLVIAREYGFSSWAKLKTDLSHGLRPKAREHDKPPQRLPSNPNLGHGIQQIFANLYRFASKARGATKKVSYSYLLIRKAGNLLICNQGSLVTDYLDQIESLGGIDTQLIGRYIDAKRGDYHDMLYQRFGCKLCYHEAEGKMTRTKTKCEAVTFGDGGLKIGTDFEAHLFPNQNWTGTCLFRWRYRGKHYLFTNDVVKQDDGEWTLRFAPELWPDKRPLFAKLTKLKLDYILPGESVALAEDIHRCTEETRKSFSKALSAKLKPRQGGIKAGARPHRPRLVTNWVSELLRGAIDSMDLFEIDKMKGHGNCALSLLLTYLEGADLMLLQNFRRKFRPPHPFLDALRKHVEQGGGLLLADNRALGDEREIISSHPFPEIGVPGNPAPALETKMPELVVNGKHPALGGLADKTQFAAAVLEHHEHKHFTYKGNTFELGSQGQILIHNGVGAPVLVAGQVGKGRVVLSSFYYGTDMPVEGAQRKIYAGILRWLAGVE